MLLARVNVVTPKAYLNEARACLIDANFSTMWTLPTSKWTAHALLAFMNGAWAQAVMERTGAVMGGGALKVEATHLRRIPVPALSDQQLMRLHELGQQLAAAGNGEVEAGALSCIDAVVVQALGCGSQGGSELRAIARAGQEQRAKHNEKRGGQNGDHVC